MYDSLVTVWQLQVFENGKVMHETLHRSMDGALKNMRAKARLYRSFGYEFGRRKVSGWRDGRVFVRNAEGGNPEAPSLTLRVLSLPLFN